jgi:hypothetical protein
MYKERMSEGRQLLCILTKNDDHELTELDYLIFYWLDFFSLRPHLLIGWIVSRLSAKLISLLVGK